jgi:hypothetical protein
MNGYQNLAFPKPVKKKTSLDMRNLPFGKTNRKQRENKAARKEVNSACCAIPGCGRKAQCGCHHILQRSELLIDHRYNLINLCDIHHPEADEFQISQVDLFELVAARDKTTVEEIIETLSEHARAFIYIDGDRVKVRKPVMRRMYHEQKAEKKEEAS